MLYTRAKPLIISAAIIPQKVIVIANAVLFNIVEQANAKVTNNINCGKFAKNVKRK